MFNLCTHYFRPILIALGTCLLVACVSAPPSTDHLNDTVIISIIGTNDVHGQLLPQPGRGGMATFSGYVEALRAARAHSNEGVLLIDAGDMWQGTLESNLSEGAAMVDAYNQLNYTAATIGNHEFDFGPTGERATPRNANDDARGALKARAAQAQFPLLAANLIDVATGQPVNWPNVQPSVLIEVAGVKVGIIGVMTIDALGATIAANTTGLRVAPLAASIISEAHKLRKQNASLVIVTAHAGGSCDNFDDPDDLSSCDLNDEIMQVAHALPKNLVDQIIAGHQHRGIAHSVNGVAITASFSSLRAFSRVDFIVNRNNGEITQRTIFAPQRVCPFVDSATQACAWSDDGTKDIVLARYENQTIKPNAAVAATADNARKQAQVLKAQPIGVYLETPITNQGRPESALGNLMTDALLQTSDATISLHNISGGIRADLPAGELTFGDVYQMFPFDNTAQVITISGADLRQVIKNQVHNYGRRAGFSGMRVFVNCANERMQIRMELNDGTVVHDQLQVKVAVNDFLALGGDNILTPVIPEEGFSTIDDAPLARDVVIKWLRDRGGRMHSAQFLDNDKKRWNLPEAVADNCPQDQVSR